MSRVRAPRRIVATVLLTVTALLTSGCFFNDLEIATLGTEEFTTVFVTTTVETRICSEIEEGVFECTLFNEDGISQIVVSAEVLDFQLALLDPLVVQLPAFVGGLTGSFVHTGTGASGSLSIMSGLATVPVDATRSLVAEPGTQLVIMELPPEAPTTGEFTFDLQFSVPPGAGEVVTKPLFTGRVELDDGRVFYAPLYPCVTDMAAVPALTITVPAGGGFQEADFALPPVDPDLFCDGEVYEYGGGGPPVPAVDIDIDIKPGSDRNPVNPAGAGVIPVAVLGTVDFDAATVDPASVAFGPNGAREAHGRGHVEDVDGDGDADLVLHFHVSESGISCGDADATLTATTADGREVTGTDAIDTVACG